MVVCLKVCGWHCESLYIMEVSVVFEVVHPVSLFWVYGW
jgi:hypothetical protein